MNIETDTTTDRCNWEVRRAKESLDGLVADARSAIRSKIEWIRRNLDEAERRLDAGEMPNTCGILQSSAMELEMALGRLTTLRDAAPLVGSLIEAIDTGREGTR